MIFNRHYLTRGASYKDDQTAFSTHDSSPTSRIWHPALLYAKIISNQRSCNDEPGQRPHQRYLVRRPKRLKRLIAYTEDDDEEEDLLRVKNVRLTSYEEETEAGPSNTST